jgi:hypothetical protein
MARPIADRLSRLNQRRKGTDRMDRLTLDEQIDIVARSIINEKYQTRAENQPYTRYALGSMQEVGPEYTKVSIITAERVGKQLDQSLSRSVEFRLQGSVPLNVHIRGVSDVDLLTIDRDFLVYDTAGHGSATGKYRSPTQDTSLGILQSLRSEAEKALTQKFPAATVDTSGSKAICVSGGSLQRPVDVVPSHWYDTVSYQAIHYTVGQEEVSDNQQLAVPSH